MSACERCKEKEYLEDGWCNYYDDWCYDYQDIDVEIAEQLEGSGKMDEVKE